MSEKNRDKRQRWRCHTVAVRLSPEESKLPDIAVKLSGLTKQITFATVAWNAISLCRAILAFIRR